LSIQWDADCLKFLSQAWLEIILGKKDGGKCLVPGEGSDFAVDGYLGNNRFDFSCAHLDYVTLGVE
jgi:hypothetical protein